MISFERKRGDLSRIAKLAGVNVETTRRYLDGIVKNPGAYTLAKIEKACDVLAKERKQAGRKSVVKKATSAGIAK